MWVIDRFEGNLAVIEHTQGELISYFELDRAVLPEEAKENDVLVQDTAGQFQVDLAETAERRERILNLLHRLEKP